VTKFIKVLSIKYKMCDHATLKLTIDNMQKQSTESRKQINKRLDKIEDSMDKVNNTITDFILKVETKFITREHAEKKFAWKLSEKIVYWMVGTILTLVLWSVLFLVIK